MRGFLSVVLALLGALLAAAWLTSSQGEPRLSGPLPDALSVVLARSGGGYESLLVQLTRPGVEPKVRRTPGIVALGPGWARTVSVANDVSATGVRSHVVEVRDPSAAEAPFGMDSQERLEVLSLDLAGLVLDVGGTPRFLAPDGRARTPSDVELLPGGRFHFKGPRKGFTLHHEDGELSLSLPKLAEGERVDLGVEAEAVLGSWWIRVADLPAWEQVTIQQLFKQQAAIPTSGLKARADGDLQEWRQVRALAVDSEAQVHSGLDYWAGPRDGSFGVAAQASQEAVILAIRVRDDDLLPGRDRVELNLDGRFLSIELRDAGGVIEGDGWREVFSEPAAYGIAFEVEIALRGEGDLPTLAVHFVDHDEGQGSSTLATSEAAAQLGAVELLR